MKRICTICARGGSKGVPGKNVRLIAGKPLIAYTLSQAKKSQLFNCIAVSSDSPDILRIASNHGADLLIQRPDDLASDRASKVPAILHCLESAEKLTGMIFDTLVDLDVTSPLRVIEDIVSAVQLMENSGGSNVITAAPARRSPYFNLVELTETGNVRISKSLSAPIFRRQDSPACFDMNASIYVWQRDRFLKNPSVLLSDTKLHIMPEERSIDIDTELDFEFVEFLIKKHPLT